MLNGKVVGLHEKINIAVSILALVQVIERGMHAPEIS